MPPELIEKAKVGEVGHCADIVAILSGDMDAKSLELVLLLNNWFL